jgi:atypical dual specificity phosphatase
MVANFSYVIEGKLAGCAHPGRYTDCQSALAWLKQRGIGAVVSLDEEGIPLYLIADQDLHYLHLPIPDFSIPAMEQVSEFLEFARKSVEGGRPVVVHCGAGYGRTGTMLACYLVSQGHTPQKAVEHVRRVRPGSIETPEQEAFVGEFERHWARSHKQPSGHSPHRRKKK